MNLSTTGIFYGLAGAGVAVALFLIDSTSSHFERWFRVLTAFLFWPLYLPLLLRPNNVATPAAPPSVPPSDDLAAQIAQVETELGLAFQSLSVDQPSALRPDQDRLNELQIAWRRQAERIRELDRLLVQPAFAASEPFGHENSVTEHAARCEQSRQQTLSQLRTIRQQRHQNLLESLAGVRELVTRIHLAKFSDTAVSSDLISQFTAAITRLSEAPTAPASEITS